MLLNEKSMNCIHPPITRQDRRNDSGIVLIGRFDSDTGRQRPLLVLTIVRGVMFHQLYLVTLFFATGIGISGIGIGRIV